MWRVRRSNSPFIEEWNGKIPMPCVGGSRFLGPMYRDWVETPEHMCWGVVGMGYSNIHI